MATEMLPRRLAAIACVDMAGYSALAERDEPRATASVAALRARVEQAARDRSGRIFNTAGDGFLIEFASAADAMGAAFDIVTDPSTPPSRVGVHLGDVLVRPDGDLLGHTVNVAARLQGEAGENCILASRAVVNLLRADQTAQLTPIGYLDIDKTDASIEAFGFDIAGKRGAETGRRKRRNRTVSMALGLAAASLVIAVYAATMAGPARDAMMQELSEEVTQRLASSGALSQESIDSLFSSVSDLSRSESAPEMRAFEQLRSGQTSSAVESLETMASDLERQNLPESAANAWGYAGALLQFSNRQRALEDFRKAHDLAPSSLRHYANYLQTVAVSQGYDAALALAREVNAHATPAVAAYGNLYSSTLAGDLGDTTGQRQYLSAATAQLASIDDEYLNAFSKIARGYLALQELDLRRARMLYEQGRAELALIPGHERDNQQGWLLVLSAMGDFETAWREGRGFVSERNESGAPPWAQMMVTTCFAGLQVDSAARVEPYCTAGAAGLAGSIGEPVGELALALLAAEKNDLVAARAHLAAARASHWFDAISTTAVHAAWIEARILARAGDFAEMDRVIDRALRRVRTTPTLAPREAMFVALMERRRADGYVAARRNEDACAALDRSIAAYRAIGGDPGAASAQRVREGLACGGI